jgi:flavin-dependent dehydrogenase
MVHTDGGRVSLSCCIRRDQLDFCRRRRPQMRAGAAVLAHIEDSCKDVALALSSATLDGAWLSAGPLRTGVHSFGRGGIFAVGNAAAEAHPIIAEGISMAIQSATLLCRHLVACPELRGADARSSAISRAVCDRIRQDYARNWRRNFSRRLRLSAVFAHLFMRPAATRMATNLLARFPQLLTLGARWSGKAEPLRGAPTAASAET